MPQPSDLTKEENLAEAERWLNKAVEFEADEKRSDKHVEMALNKAHAHERAALGY